MPLNLYYTYIYIYEKCFTHFHYEIILPYIHQFKKKICSNLSISISGWGKHSASTNSSPHKKRMRLRDRWYNSKHADVYLQVKCQDPTMFLSCEWANALNLANKNMLLIYFCRGDTRIDSQTLPDLISIEPAWVCMFDLKIGFMWMTLPTGSDPFSWRILLLSGQFEL